MSVMAVARRIKKLEARVSSQDEWRSHSSFNVTNGSGTTLVAGWVVALDNTRDRTVIAATGAGDQAPTVVIVGGDDNSTVKCTCRGYGVVRIQCDGGAIAQGDAIVASATAWLGVVDNTATARNLLGFALSSKGAGTVEYVDILV